MINLDLNAILKQIEKQIEEEARQIKSAKVIIDNLLANPTMLSKAYKIEPASYYGIMKGDEVFYCVRPGVPKSFVMRRMMEPSKKFNHALTDAGKDMIKKGPTADKDYNVMFVDFEALSIPQSSYSMSMWQELFDMKQFKYWYPKEGPLKYVLDAKKSGQIGLFRAFKTKLRMRDIKFKKAHNNQQMIFDVLNPDVFDKEILESAEPIINDTEFGKIKIAICETIQKHFK